MEKRVETLEKRVAKLEGGGKAPAKPRAAATPRTKPPTSPDAPPS